MLQAVYEKQLQTECRIVDWLSPWSSTVVGGSARTPSSALQGIAVRQRNSQRERAKGLRRGRQPSQRDPARPRRAWQAAVTNGGVENAPPPRRTSGRSPKARSTRNRTDIGTEG